MDSLLGKLPTSSNSTHCRAGKWRPVLNALRPKQCFISQEGTGASAHRVSVIRDQEQHEGNSLQIKLVTPAQLPTTILVLRH